MSMTETGASSFAFAAGTEDGSSPPHDTEKVRECKIVVLNLNGKEVCSFSRRVRITEEGPGPSGEGEQCSGHDAVGDGPDKPSSVRKEQCSGHDAVEDGPDKIKSGCGPEEMSAGGGGRVVGSGGGRPGGARGSPKIFDGAMNSAEVGGRRSFSRWVQMQTTS